MGSCREIITLQLGNYSNYVGAHWWNIQESSFQYGDGIDSEICHDVLFREGRSQQGYPTFTPRAILVDYKENMNCVPVISEEPPPDTSEASTELMQPAQKHEYQSDLDQLEVGSSVSQKDYKFSETVRSWCDYMRTRFHSRSVLVTGQSDSLFKVLEDDLTDRLRMYAEECDNIQGFQILMDAVDGFGQLSQSVMEYLQDEFSGKSMITFLTTPSYYVPEEALERSVMSMLCYPTVCEYSSLVVPLSTNLFSWRSVGTPVVFPHLQYQQSVLYETSAILAAFLDTITLRYRLVANTNSLHDIISGLSLHNRKLAAGSLSFPFPKPPSSYLFNTLESIDDTVPVWKSLTPGCTLSGSSWFETISLRGFSKDKLRAPGQTLDNQAASCTTVEDIFSLYLTYKESSIVSNIGSTTLPLNTSQPFPDIFSPHVSRLGSVDETATRVQGLRVDSCSTVAGLHSCEELSEMLQTLHTSARQVNIKKYFKISGKVSQDEFEDCLEKLKNLQSAYVPSMEF